MLALLLIIMIVLFIMRVQKKVRYECGFFRTPMGLANVCVRREDFNIPMEPTSLCETRCQTNLDHAQLLGRGILAKNCVMKCDRI